MKEEAEVHMKEIKAVVETFTEEEEEEGDE